MNYTVMIFWFFFTSLWNELIKSTLYCSASKGSRWDLQLVSPKPRCGSSVYELREQKRDVRQRTASSARRGSIESCNCCQDFFTFTSSMWSCCYSVRVVVFLFKDVPLLSAAENFPSMERIKHFSWSWLQGVSIRRCETLLLTPEKPKPIVLFYITASGVQTLQNQKNEKGWSDNGYSASLIVGKHGLFEKEYQIALFTQSLGWQPHSSDV